MHDGSEDAPRVTGAQSPAPATPATEPLPDWLADEMPTGRHGLDLESGRYRGHRMHLIDTGVETARPVLFLHGNPTWCFLWRRVIARLEGLRAVAPDLLGLGLSSKLPAIGDHTVSDHADAIAEAMRRMELEGVILVVQDWGGPIGAAAAAREHARIAGLVILNTAVILPERPRGTAFHRFARRPIVSDLVFRLFGFPLGILHRAQGDPSSIRGTVARAYRWPLRKLRDRIAPLALARMVPDSPEHPSMPAMLEGQAWVKGFSGPTALVWGTEDPILGRALKRHRQALPDAEVTTTPAGHFLQEEVPDEIAAAIHRVAARLGDGISR